MRRVLASVSYGSGPVPIPNPSKPALLALLLAWPLAALFGLGVGRLTHTDWPAAAFAFGWLLLVFRVLRGYASRSR